MRLTADLINSSLSYLNPLKERELDLRGALEKANDIVVFGEGSECIEPQLDNHTLFQND